jgi:hypothetical protein
MGSIPASFDTVESEGRQMKQWKKPKNSPFLSFCVAGVHPLSAQAPRTVVESAVPPTSSTQQPATIKSENVRSVILDPKDDVLVLDDIKVGISMIFWYGSGSGSCYFCQFQDLRIFFAYYYFLKVHLHHFSKDKKS